MSPRNDEKRIQKQQHCSAAARNPQRLSSVSACRAGTNLSNLASQFLKAEPNVQPFDQLSVTIRLSDRSRHRPGMQFLAADLFANLPVNVIVEIWIRWHRRFTGAKGGSCNPPTTIA